MNRELSRAALTTAAPAFWPWTAEAASSCTGSRRLLRRFGKMIGKHLLDRIGPAVDHRRPTAARGGFDGVGELELRLDPESERTEGYRQSRSRPATSCVRSM